VIGTAESETALAATALGAYGFADGTTVSLLNRSENSTFLLRPPGRPAAVLRLHRADYHDAVAIESELSWLAALREAGVVRVPGVVPAQDGRRVVPVGPAQQPRHVVVFEHLAGREPDPEALRDAEFQRLGAITARLHEHARSWRRPAPFRRFTWDTDALVGSAARWGRWHDVSLPPADLATLHDAVALVGRRLADFGTGAERFGLVHADLRPANLLVDGDEVGVLDFDDCGFSWYLYDFGTAVSFLEDDERLPAWQQAWVQGYRSVAALSPQDEALLPTFVLLRRMALQAWLGSHRHSVEVAALGDRFARGSVGLARRYLDSDGRRVS
jgi:Ser/Thr protein kinase RdoA (MazF antagonist)